MRYYYQSQPGLTRHKQSLHAFWKEIGLFQAGKQRLCDQVRMIKKKYQLSQLQIEELRRLVESCESNFEAQEEEPKRTCTDPIQQVTEEHIKQNEDDEGGGKENAKLLINYDNSNTVEKQNILKIFY